MGRIPQQAGSKGSLRWIQRIVNDYPEVIDEAIGLGEIDWCSPLRDDEHAEYRDQEFLDILKVECAQRTLSTFWPVRGPQWDALGRTKDTIVLVEAKSHVPEMLSPATQAKGISADHIRASLSEASLALKATPGADWSLRFYQYANRLAHAWFLAEANEIPTQLVFLYFVGDSEMGGPANTDVWEAATMVVHETLGLRGRMPKYAKECFIDVSGSVPEVVGGQPEQ